MAGDEELYETFLGTGWSFPPTFTAGGVQMRSEEADIAESLAILFGTTPGERFLQPKFGLDVRALVFEPMSTTLRTFLKDRARLAILLYEPRIDILRLEIDAPDPNEGTLAILLEYSVRTANSRFNLVFPFYRTDSNEVRDSVGAART